MFIGFANKYQKFIGIFFVRFKDRPTIEHLQRMMDIIQTEFETYYIQNKKIFHQSIDSLKSIFGESATVSFDLNTLYYGIEYTESILQEWEEYDYDRKLCINLSNDTFIFPEEEGSVSILESLLVI